MISTIQGLPSVKLKSKAIYLTVSIACLIATRLFLLNITVEVELQKNEQPAVFVDQLFEPLLKAFKKFHPDAFSPPDRTGKIPKFLLIPIIKPRIGFWVEQTKHITSNECPLPCELTSDVNDQSVDAVVFYLRDVKDSRQMNKWLPNRNLSQPWIMLSFEAPKYANNVYHTKYDRFNGVFNRTMLYKSDSDIIVSHGFVVAKNDTKHLPRSWVIPSPPYQRPKKLKKLAAAMISNCGDFSGRLDYIKKLQKHARVDVFGQCGKFKCGESRYAGHGYNITDDKCYKMIDNNYLFYLSFENSLCEDYVTEKLYNIMYYNVVPVVFGAADYTKILPPNSYINALEFTPKKLAKHLLALQNNLTLYEEYLQWKKDYQVSTIGGARPLCHLCVRLHDPTFYQNSVVKDFKYWFETQSKCWRRWKPNIFS